MNRPYPWLLPPAREYRSRLELLRRASTNLYGLQPTLQERLPVQRRGPGGSLSMTA